MLQTILLILINLLVMKHERGQFTIARLQDGNVLIELRPPSTPVEQRVVAETVEMKNFVCGPLEILSVESRRLSLAVLPLVVGVEYRRQDVGCDGYESADDEDEGEAEDAEGCVEAGTDFLGWDGLVV